jgi:hypothetical protein
MAEEQTWGISITVENNTPDPCLDAPSSRTEATWQPDSELTWTNGQTIDLYTNTAGTAQFSLNLNFDAGTQEQCPGDPYDVGPTGTLVSSFSDMDTNMSGSADCESSCNAFGNWQNELGLITGYVDVSSSTTPETRTGTFKVVWTPSESNVTVENQPIEPPPITEP